MAVIGTTGVLSPGRWLWLRAVGWMVALCVAIVVGFNAAAKATLLLLGANEAASSDKLIGAVAGSIAVLFIYRVAIRYGERRTIPELELRKAPTELLIGLAIGTTLMAAIVALLWLFGWVVVEARTVDGVALALRDSIRSGVVEELVLRLVILRLLWRAIGIWPAIALTALLFGALHLANPDSSLFAAACLAAGEGIGIGLYLITGRIWASIGMHAAWNFTQGWIFGAAVSGTEGIAGGPLALRPVAGVPDILHGGGFGPEASLASLIVSLLASTAFLVLAWRLGRFATCDEQSGAPAATNKCSVTVS